MNSAFQDRPRNVYGVYDVPRGVEHRVAARAILAGLPYEPDTLTFMRANVGRGDIIHAGAFFGDFLPGLSSALAPTARVWAFEPVPLNFASAQKTLALNGIRNVTLANAALSDRAATLSFRTMGEDGRLLGGASHCVDDQTSADLVVPCVRLDDVVPADRTVSILHLDVERHEKPALAGAVDLVTRCRPVLILEAFEDEGWLNRVFTGVSYRALGKLHDNHVYVAQGSEIGL